MGAALRHPRQRKAAVTDSRLLVSGGWCLRSLWTSLSSSKLHQPKVREESEQYTLNTARQLREEINPVASTKVNVDDDVGAGGTGRSRDQASATRPDEVVVNKSGENERQRRVQEVEEEEETTVPTLARMPSIYLKLSKSRLTGWQGAWSKSSCSNTWLAG